LRKILKLDITRFDDFVEETGCHVDYTLDPRSPKVYFAEILGDPHRILDGENYFLAKYLGVDRISSPFDVVRQFCTQIGSFFD
jgi:hypothetical protein